MLHLQGRLAQRGLTLLELLFTITIMGITLGVAVPAFQSWLPKHRADSATRAVATAFQHARSEAIMRNQIISLCGSDDGLNCARGWRGHLLTFIDTNDDYKAQPSELINKHTFSTGHTQFASKISAQLSRLQINPDGTVRQFGSVIYCDEQGQSIVRQLVWNRVGRLYNATLTQSGDSYVNSKGDIVTCRL